MTELRNAFNSPFMPFVLSTTSVGQEGLDFRWYCHAIVHWNVPNTPVDFEQRDGPIYRYRKREGRTKRSGRTLAVRQFSLNQITIFIVPKQLKLRPQ